MCMDVHSAQPSSKRVPDPMNNIRLNVRDGLSACVCRTIVWNLFLLKMECSLFRIDLINHRSSSMFVFKTHSKSLSIAITPFHFAPSSVIRNCRRFVSKLNINSNSIWKMEMFKSLCIWMGYKWKMECEYVCVGRKKYNNFSNLHCFRVHRHLNCSIAIFHSEMKWKTTTKK